jgi:hypothetical protein
MRRGDSTPGAIMKAVPVVATALVGPTGETLISP